MVVIALKDGEQIAERAAANSITRRLQVLSLMVAGMGVIECLAGDGHALPRPPANTGSTLGGAEATFAYSHVLIHKGTLSLSDDRWHAKTKAGHFHLQNLAYPLPILILLKLKVIYSNLTILTIWLLQTNHHSVLDIIDRLHNLSKRKLTKSVSNELEVSRRCHCIKSLTILIDTINWYS